MSAGDYRLFRSENAENRSLETGVANSQKPAIGGPSASVLAILSGRRTGWVATQWDSNPSPCEFPANREFYREFCDFELSEAGLGGRIRCAAATFRTIPYAN